MINLTAIVAGAYFTLLLIAVLVFIGIVGYLVVRAILRGTEKTEENKDAQIMGKIAKLH